MRDSDKGLKTQIRFRADDISLYTKRKGSDEPFIEVDMTDIIGKLPAIEANIKWRRKPDLPAWRKASPEARVVTLKSLAGATREGDSSSDRQPLRKKSMDVNVHADSSMSDSSSDDSPANTTNC